MLLSLLLYFVCAPAMKQREGQERQREVPFFAWSCFLFICAADLAYLCCLRCSSFACLRCSLFFCLLCFAYFALLCFAYFALPTLLCLICVAYVTCLLFKAAAVYFKKNCTNKHKPQLAIAL
jgi:hypothetical protein